MKSQKELPCLQGPPPPLYLTVLHSLCIEVSFRQRLSVSRSARSGLSCRFFCNERKRLSVSERFLRVFGPMASRRQSVAALTCCRPSVSLPHERWESPDVPTCCFPFKGDPLHRLNVALRSVPKCCRRASVWRRAVEQFRDGCGTVHHLQCDWAVHVACWDSPMTCSSSVTVLVCVPID
jgi:hypothetical protein